MRERMSRFNEYMIIKGLNDNQVESECGIGHGVLNQCRTGKSDLGAKSIDKILRKYQDLSRQWLLAGAGDMLVSQDIHHVTQHINGNNNANNLTNDPATIDVILRLTKMLEAERAEVERLKAELAELKK